MLSALFGCFRRETIPVSVLQLRHCPEQHSQGPPQASPPGQRGHCHGSHTTGQSARLTETPTVMPLPVRSTFLHGSSEPISLAALNLVRFKITSTYKEKELRTLTTTYSV